MSFTVHVVNDFDQLSQLGAQIVEAAIAERQAAAGSFVLGLATGSSPTGLYKHLAKAFNAGRLDARRVRTFNLDEYVGLPGGNAQQRALHPESYGFFMVSELFGLVNPRIAETDVPWGTLIDEPSLQAALDAGEGFELAGTNKGRAVVIGRQADGYLGWVRDEILDSYASRIAQAGGIDLHIIGVGGRGHVAFHESGIPFEAGAMLLVQLDDNTITNAVADGHFPTTADAPHFAVTMGAEQVFKARQVLLVANDARKTGPVTEAVLGEITADVPLSYCQKYVADGGHLTFVLAEAAAAGLLARREEVAARGIEVVDHRGEPYEPVASLMFSRSPGTGTLT